MAEEMTLFVEVSSTFKLPWVDFARKILGLVRRMILKWISDMGCGYIHWIWTVSRADPLDGRCMWVR